MDDLVFCLMGPTASGKTALALELANHFPFEIISVDSAMIYRDMDIGTAKPTVKELQQTPHHLLNILDPPASFSVAQFCLEAEQLIQVIKARHKIPLLVGGTMMYFNALQQGLTALPKAKEDVRTHFTQEALRLGWQALHDKLRQFDPLTAARVHPNDTQRIQRALEVHHITGQPLSTLLAQQRQITSYQFINLILFPQQRAWLHQRIATRFQQMLEQGFIAEVEQLLCKWSLTSLNPAMRCVGYRQAMEYLAGEYNYVLFCEKGIAATRQLAKRQLTWLRHWPSGHYFASDKQLPSLESIALIAEILDNHVSKKSD